MPTRPSIDLAQDQPGRTAELCFPASSAFVSVIVPILNEVDNVDSLVGAIVGEARDDLKFEILIADGGSTDGTVERVRAWERVADVRLIASDGKRGLAGDVLHAASVARADIVVVMDGDLSHPADRIHALVQPLLDRTSDMVVGSPPPGATSRELEARGSAAAEDARPDVRPTIGELRRLYQCIRASLRVTRGPLLAADLIMASVAAFILAACFFLLSPGLDIAVADIFYIPGHGFIGRVPWVEALRFALNSIFVAGATLAVIGLLRSAITARPFAGLTAIRWLFLTLALSVGPGLVANVLLKDQMGRARPHQVDIFGGSKKFTAPLIAAEQCRRNCSFVSGEAASMFALFFALSFLVTRHSTALICAALAMGSLAGLIRMAQGAHFLSDVAFAGIFMCVSVAGLHLLIVDAQPLWRRAALALADRRGRNDRNR